MIYYLFIVESMATLVKHDGDFICSVFGLGNNGTLCYLNSVTQALASCPAFVKGLKEREDKTAPESLGSRMFQLFSKYLTTEGSQVSIKGVPHFQKIKKDMTGAILSAIQKAREGRKSTLQSFKQEDVFEGLKFILEELGDPFLNLFYTRHKQHIRCTACGSKHDVKDDTCQPEIMINMSESDPILQKSLDSQTEIEKYIKLHMLYPDDYSCETCKAKNNNKANPPLQPVQQFYTLGRISSIIIMSFHENMQVLFDNAHKGEHTARVTRFFPNELRIATKQGILVYRVVAQIEQFGSLSGGHYTAKCLRPRPHGFSEIRLTAANRALQDAKERLKSCQNPERIAALQAKERNAQKAVNEETAVAALPDMPEMANLDQFIKKYYAVFNCNDDKVAYDVKGFVPSPNTYLVFYHLFQILVV